MFQLELTVPWEDHFGEAFERNPTKYDGPLGHKLISVSWVAHTRVYDVERPKTLNDARNITEDVSRSINRFTSTSSIEDGDIEIIVNHLKCN